MNTSRSVAHVAAVLGLAALVTGCGRMVGYPAGAPPPSCTRAIANETAAPLPAGGDAMTALEQRPIAPPAAAIRECASASGNLSGSVAPNYGAGVGPLFLGGQDTWYAAGQAVLLAVDAGYSGPLLLRPYHVSGPATAVTLADVPASSFANFTDKETAHGHAVISVLHTAAGGLYISAVTPGSPARVWLGDLSTDGAGWFGFQVDGDGFTEFIVIQVNAGTPPPG